MTAPDPSQLSARLGALPGAEPVIAAIAGGDEEVWLVGGAVRDLWLGARPLDLDLVVVGDVGRLADRLGAGRSHERFGTATVRGCGGARYDLAQARRETYRAPGALPDVAAAGIAEDLQRRDFSVNALALALNGPRRGALETVAHGADDLVAGRLRVLHPASFRDDPTRLLRLARYAARLGFSVEKQTGELARAAVSGGALATVSGERIGAELTLLGEESDPVAAFGALSSLGIDDALAPGFGLSAGADQALARRALALLPADGDRVALLLGLASRRMSDMSTHRGCIAHLGLPAGRRDAALAVAGDGAGGLVAALAGARTPSQVEAAIGGAPVEVVAVAGALGDEAVTTRAREWLRAWRHTTLQIGGADLIAAGIPEGPQIAAGLRAARAATLDGRAGDREGQLVEALGAARAAG